MYLVDQSPFGWMEWHLTAEIISVSDGILEMAVLVVKAVKPHQRPSNDLKNPCPELATTKYGDNLQNIVFHSPFAINGHL